MEASVEADLHSAKRCIHQILRDFDFERKELNGGPLKELKGIVRRNGRIVGEFVDELFKHVRQSNCDRRLAVLLIANEFFQRSHLFRLEITNSFQDWLIYTAETDPLHYPLPLPKEAASALKLETLKTVKVWHDKFASAYPKLGYAYNFLLNSKAFDFERANAELQVVRNREEEAARLREAKEKLVMEQVKREISDRQSDIRECIMESRAAIELLVPKFVDSSADDRPTTSASSRELHAYIPGETISVTVPLRGPVVEVSDANEPLVRSVLDSLKLLRCFEKLIARWTRKLSKFGGGGDERTMKTILDLKADVAVEIERCTELKLPDLPKRKRSRRSSESESDDDFVDVPEKEGLELDFKVVDDAILPHEAARIRELESESLREAAAHGEVSRTGLHDDHGSPNEEEKRSMAPVIPFGLDLKYWGEADVVPAEVPRNNSDCHRFWRPSDESDTTCVDAAEHYHARVITFVGKEDRSERSCRAPLKNGQLCPRRDRRRCPIHGVIVDRDSMGFPLKPVPVDPKMEAAKEREEKEFVKDVELAVGVELSRTASRKNRRTPKKRQPTEAEVVRTRLSAKLFNRSAVKRVSETLDAIGKARAARNFEHQFNYALTRT